jgi:ribose transport system substrate-binding protein
VSAEAQAANTVLDGYRTAPTTITQTEALPKAPPTGKKVIWMNCDLPVCSLIGGGVKAAATAAGWTFAQINYQGADPATLTAGMNRALQEQPTVVVNSGIPPEAGWSSVIPAYKKAGVPIIAAYIATAADQLPQGVIANVGGPPVFDEYAKLVANWFIADSNGQGKALIQRVDAYPILKTYADDLVKYIKAGCAKCDVSTQVQNTAADAASNNIVPTVVSALKRDPSLTYLLPCDLEFFDGLPSAMAAAGLSHVKVAGQNPTLEGLSLIQSGKFAMAPQHPNEEAGWVIMDAAFHNAMGLAVPAGDNGPLPTQLLLPGGNFETQKFQDTPLDYPAQFKKLWQLG